MDEVKINGALWTYANLWAWAQANSVVVADVNWAADLGALSSGNGTTTFRLQDIRGRFPRFFDDGRGVDAGRVFRSSANKSSKSVNAFVLNCGGDLLPALIRA